MNDTSRPFATPVGPQLRVLVVDDSALQRTMLANLFAADPGIEVVGQAQDGPEAIRLTASLHPDVITIDLRMPGMDGLAATRRIMQETPTPVVLVSAGISPEDRHLIGEALAAGVLAVVAKPTPGPRGAQATAELITTVKRMAGVRVIRRRSLERGNTGQLSPPTVPTNTGQLGPLPDSPATLPSGPRPAIVAIGSSTGGPQALQTILTRLPATFQPPIVIVQHIAAGFATSIVDWLGPQCALPFQLVTAGMRLDRPGIYLAPTGHHLVVQGHGLVLNDEPPVRGHRPSATNLFRSVAASYGSRAIGVLLTGMGDDGAAGLAEMKRLGATTIAQDEASSVVFGMPAAAIALGVVDHIVSPAQIPALLQRLAAVEARRPARGLLPTRDPRASG
ncbi:MAG TPA: chemotaxis-specific protein-glutamate methyltransferase CheB [Thermomicrobiales bacterium]|jgi:two-component system chemotaxis response regulator CheB